MAADYGHDDCGCDPGDDRYDEYKDGVAMGYINEDGSQREPDFESHPMFGRYEHERYLRSLSPLRRFFEPARAFIWSRTWKWRTRRNAGKWREPEFPFPDEPPF
jgi:hypothetical protein